MNIEEMHKAIKLAIALKLYNVEIGFAREEFALILRAAEIGMQAANGSVGVGGDISYRIPNGKFIARYILEGK